MLSSLSSDGDGRSDALLARLEIDLTCDRILSCEATVAAAGMRYSDTIAQMVQDVYSAAQQRDVARQLDREALIRLFESGSDHLQLEYQRFIDKAASPFWVRTGVRLFRDAATGHILSLQHTFDVDRQVMAETVAESVLTRTVDLFGMIFVKNGVFRYYRSGPPSSEGRGGGDCLYSQRILDYIERYVPPDKREAMGRQLQLDGLVEKLNETGHFSTVFLLPEGGVSVFKRWDFFWLNDAHEVIAVTSTDVTDLEILRVHSDNMRQALENSQTIPCFYDVARRTLTVPSYYAELYGLEPVIQNMPEGMSCVADGDRDAYNALFDRIAAGAESGELTVQMQRADGTACWERISFTSRFGDDGRPLSAVLTAKDVTDERARAIDSERTRILIERNGICIFDYDVTLDTLHFETLFQGVGFLQKDYPHYFDYVERSELVHPEHKAAMRETIRRASLTPCSGTFEYIANNWGTGYRWSSMFYSSLADASGRVYRIVGQITDIQAEKERETLLLDLNRRLRSEKAQTSFDPLVISQAFQYLSAASNPAEDASHVLTLLGRQYRASHVDILETQPETGVYRLSYEWCADGAVSHRGVLDRPSDGAQLRRALEAAMDDRGVFCCGDTERLEPVLRGYLTGAGIRAALYSRLTCDNETIGLLGFDDCCGARNWTAEQAGTLGLLSSIISLLLARERQRRAVALSDDLRVTLDNSSLHVYVVEPRSHRILYRNTALRESIGDEDCGDVCYRHLTGRDAPCEDCPIHAVDSAGRFVPVEIARRDGLCVLAQASSVHWNGEPAYMISCTDITRRKAAEEELRVSAAENAIVIRQSGKSAYRYDIATDTAVNLLDGDDQIGLPNVIRHYSRAMLRHGFFAPESEAAHRRFLRSIRRGEPFGSTDVLLLPPDGSSRWYHADYSLVCGADGVPSHAIISFFDNSVQREKEIAYEKWQTKLDALLTLKTPYLEVNLSQDSIVRAENLMASFPASAMASFSAFSNFTVKTLIDRGHIPAYRHFFDRERLLGLYCSGQIQDSLEYLASPEGAKHWYRVEVQLVKYPVGDDIKAFILFTDIDAEVRERQRLELRACTDKMTGLLNRDAMKTGVDNLLRRASDDDRLALFMIDLDNFKVVNDTLGHQRGDAELIRAAGAIRSVFRSEDLVCRIGGDEFMVFMNGGATPALVRKRAEALLAALQGSVGDICVSASIGIAMVEGSEASFDRLYELSDRALYASKRGGKNSYSVWDDNAPKSH